MKFIYGAAIQNAVQQVMPSSIAVAYVGRDWKSYVDSRSLKEIIISPTIGTNPYAVMEIAKAIGWDNVYFLDNLHSKIYLGNRAAAVGSFNLTANGLGSEGLQEAGFLVSDPDVLRQLRERLEDYKEQSLVAYPLQDDKLKRLAELRDQWDRAIKMGVIRNDGKRTKLSDYHPVAADEFYVCGVWGNSAGYSDQLVSPSTVGASVSFLEEDDVRPDRWILCWTALSDGRPDERSSPYWMHIDEVVSHGAIDRPYTKLALQREDRQESTPPFELTDEVASALMAVLNSGRFPEFLVDADPWPLNKTLPNLSNFLASLREHLAQSHANNVSGLEFGSIDSLRQTFSERIRMAMNEAREKRIVTEVIETMLRSNHAVEVAKKLVKPGAQMQIKSGLKKLAKANSLSLSFESIMLEEQFRSLFNTNDLECARFNLFEADSTYGQSFRQ